MNIDEIKELARNSADKHEFNRECTEWHSHYYGFILGMQKALILPAVVKSVKENTIPTFQEWMDENDITLYCGKYYANMSVEGWTWRQIDKIYKKDTHQL